MPDRIAEAEIEVGAATARKTERAAAAVRRADEVLPGSWEPIARVLLRTEGVASSDIEGLRAPITAIVAAEVDEGTDRTAAWVADNLAVVGEAIRSSNRRLTVSTLHRWHRRLMRHSDLPPHLVGSFRDAQGWIGGSSPLDAVYDPPPPIAVNELMDDLVRFANRDDLDPIVQAASLHAQFETIHPYGDGNGRLGRVLISWALARRLEVALPPPVSVLIARDPGGYLSGLYQFRDGTIDAYLGWFAEIVARAGDASVILGDRVRALIGIWEQRLVGLRGDAAARSVVGLLPEHPLVSSRIVAERLGVSERTARNALVALGDVGILSPVDVPRTAPGRPWHWWAAPEFLDLVQAWAG